MELYKKINNVQGQYCVLLDTKRASHKAAEKT